MQTTERAASHYTTYMRAEKGVPPAVVLETRP